MLELERLDRRMKRTRPGRIPGIQAKNLRRVQKYSSSSNGSSSSGEFLIPSEPNITDFDDLTNQLPLDVNNYFLQA